MIHATISCYWGSSERPHALEANIYWPCILKGSVHLLDMFSPAGSKYLNFKNGGSWFKRLILRIRPANVEDIYHNVVLTYRVSGVCNSSHLLLRQWCFSACMGHFNPWRSFSIRAKLDPYTAMGDATVGLCVRYNKLAGTCKNAEFSFSWERARWTEISDT